LSSSAIDVTNVFVVPEADVERDDLSGDVEIVGESADDDSKKHVRGRE
jgi:hypothetical protein